MTRAFTPESDVGGFLPPVIAASGSVTQAAVAAIVRRYGTGIDGDLTVAGTRSETQHRCYLSLTVPSGQVLQPSGFIVAARRQITIAGTVRRNGTTATTGAAAANITTNAIGGAGHSAAAGQTGAGAAAGGSTTNPYYGGKGGDGGLGTGGAGGTSGTLTAGATFLGRFDVDPWCSLLDKIASSAVAATSWATGSGGSGGGGNGVQTGGGGGSCAGGIILMAPIIEIQSGGLIQAIGGDGAPGQASNCGGGGGGGGGVVILLCEQLIETGSISVAGGSGGASGGAGGAAGSSGGVGSIFRTGVA